MDLLPEYALGVLEGADLAAVEALLAQSAEARAALAAFEATLAGVAALTTPARQAPTRLTADFAARLQAGQPAAQANPRPSPIPFTPAASAARRSGRRALVAALSAAAAVILIVLALSSVSGGLLNIRNLFPTSDLAQRQIDEVIANPAVRKVALTFSEAQTQANAMLYAIPDGTRAVLEVNRLNPAPEGKDYQVWLLVGGIPQSAGVFRVETTQYPTRVLISARAPFQTYSVVALSVEPQGGSAAPTTSPFASANLE